ncbi:phenylalanine--tRNA ligase subunit beta [soil metagenome]
MRFSVRWLQQYLQTDLPLPKLLEAITDCGLEVEEVVDLGMGSGKLVVGEILKIDAIEGADKIRLCTVQANEPQPLRIVCGAQNISVGDRVPVARFGMKFPGGFELKPRKIMGIEGEGMLCSAKELGVAEDADGIWLLPDGAKVGEPFDALVEIAITPNRPDALSIVGVARDLAAKIGSMKSGAKATVKMPDLNVVEASELAASAAKITVQAREECPRYTARVIRNVQVGPSPLWMQRVLESAGLRPINNLVDITNFVLLELGHPLHAFDLDKLSGQQVIVRTAQEGETITTLDGAEQKLAACDLLICDAKKPVALAGIMGGNNSEISAETKNVLLESAYFKPQTIRKTRKGLDKATDASYRFERGTDPRRLTAPLNRAAQLMADLAGGTVLRGVIDVVANPPQKEPITVRIARLSKVLGLEVSGREIIDVLTPLGFEMLRSDREIIQVEAPSHRPDVIAEVDVIEEVGRILGFDRIAEKKLTMKGGYAPASPLDRVRETLSQAAAAAGLHQAINLSFVSEKGNGIVGANDEKQVRVLNPIIADQAVMRRSLLPSLLQNIAHNLNHGVEQVSLFETGVTYEFAEEADRDARDMRPAAIETPCFAAIIAGGGKPNWKEAARDADFFAVKGLTETLLNAVGLQKLVVESAPNVAWLHPGRAARFLVKGQVVATFGELHPAVLKELDIKTRAYCVEIPLSGLILEDAGREKFKDIPRFPAVTRDIALVVDRSARSLDLERTIKKAAKELLSGVRLFDVYDGDKIAAEKKSLAYSLTYRAEDRTLKETEVTEAHQAVLAQLEKEHGATLRT